jgi:hypothetical protein
MDPANVREALREVSLDVEEGADIVMVKPALPYLDVIRAVAETSDRPVAAYNVSGEYHMKAAGPGLGEGARQTKLLSIRRRCDMIITYWARQCARLTLRLARRTARSGGSRPLVTSMRIGPTRGARGSAGAGAHGVEDRARSALAPARTRISATCPGRPRVSSERIMA